MVPRASFALVVAASCGHCLCEHSASSACEAGSAECADVDDIAQLQMTRGLRRREEYDDWEIRQADGSPNKREEAAAFTYGNDLCLFGGREWQPIECLRGTTWKRFNTWTDNLHHVHPIFYDGLLWIIQGWTGNWLDERDIDRIRIWNPLTDQMTTGKLPDGRDCWIPSQYRTGAGGTVEYNGNFYLVSGASSGHLQSVGAYATKRFVKFDPTSCTWTNMAAPLYERDHFQAVLVQGHKLIAAGGRWSSFSSNDNEAISHPTAPSEMYDFESEGDGWVRKADIPTPRGGCANVAVGKYVYVSGGETDRGNDKDWANCNHPSSLKWYANREVSRYDVETDTWDVMPEMVKGRHAHGSGWLWHGGRKMLRVAGGVECAGGGTELESAEEWILPIDDSPGIPFWAPPSLLAASAARA